MEWFRELVFGTGIAHSILLLALVIAVGAALAKIKVAGVSLGMTWILFVGIVASHFGLVLDPVVLGFIRDFGLIVFIFAVGMQVGPSFFSSFRKGGLKLRRAEYRFERGYRLNPLQGGGCEADYDDRYSLRCRDQYPRSRCSAGGVS